MKRGGKGEERRKEVTKTKGRTTGVADPDPYIFGPPKSGSGSISRHQHQNDNVNQTEFLCSIKKRGDKKV